MSLLDLQREARVRIHNAIDAALGDIVHDVYQDGHGDGKAEACILCGNEHGHKKWRVQVECPAHGGGNPNAVSIIEEIVEAETEVGAVTSAIVRLGLLRLEGTYIRQVRRI